MSQSTSGKKQKTDSLLCKESDRFKRAHKVFFKTLKKHPDIYYAYQANIAMAFQDEVHAYRYNTGHRYLNRKEIHVLANRAAKNFLNLLIKE